jgi:hypothetical protein
MVNPFAPFPPQWSDVVAVDPEIAMGRHRALFRVVDLLELAGLVDRLSKRDLRENSRCRVREIAPHT